MEKILYTKLVSTFGKKEAEKIVGEDTLRRLKHGETHIYFHVLCRKLNLEKEIGYTFEDFKLDFKEQLEKYIEKELVYKVWTKGYSLYAYCKKLDIDQNTLYRICKRGRQIIGDDLKYKLIDLFDIEYDIHDIDSFKIELHEEFCKIIGSKAELEILAKKYDIDFPVLFYNNQYSIAFDGWFFEIIKKYHKGS